MQLQATTITQKGQVTISKEIREFLGIQIGERVHIKPMDKKTRTITITPLPKLSALAGSFKVKNPKDPVKLREYMEKRYTPV